MIKKLLGLVAFVCLVTIGILALHPAKSHAAFTANRLMDDGVMDGYSSMNVGQIDAWLNANFPNSCISTNRGFTAAVPSGYSPSTGYTYGSYGSAGAVIAASAQAYEINPRVLLVTLQKEQSLVAGDAGCSVLRYTGATGYGCPDGGTTHDYSGMNPALYAINGVPVNSVSGTCVNAVSKAGFSQQVIRAAWLLKFGEQRSEGNTNWAIIKGNWNNSDDPQTCYGGPMTQGNRKRCSSDSSTVFYDGYITIDGQSTHMDTGATAALYWYTPHFAGNQNFVNLYESWFGPTKGVDYAWQYIGATISGGSWVVKGNSQYTITLTAKNTGNQSWSNTNYPVRLGTFLPTNHDSILYDPSWYSSTKLATLNESVVLPGANGTFTFVVNIPNREGLYEEHFNLAAEGAAWMQDIGFTFQFSITKATYSWQMVSQSSNATTGFMLTPGAIAQFTLVAKNTGNTNWTNSGAHPVRLGTWSSANHISPLCSDNTNWQSWAISCARAAVLQESSVAPGQNGTFVFTVQAPQTPRLYIERFNLIAEGYSWFDDPWMEFDVTVGNFYRWQMVSQSSSTGTFAMLRNSTATFTLTARNTGNVTWTNSGNLVRLATWNPPYRTSAFNDGSWVNTYRAANLTQTSVAPGQTGTFVFNVRAPNTAGLYIERFNLVMEGAAWFEDPWLEFDIPVN